ncbi:MAG: hypothetical protein ACLUGU_15090 [Alistipes shahii]
MTGYKAGYFAPYPVDLSIGTTWEGITTPVTGSFSETSIASYAGRFNYAFDKKYLVEFTFRADGSYKFAPENRWGFFPSAAVGWVMSEEKFFKQALLKIDFFKLRALLRRTGYGRYEPLSLCAILQIDRTLLQLYHRRQGSDDLLHQQLCLQATLPGRVRAVSTWAWT